MLVLLKSYPEHAANAPFVYARRVGVGEAAHVFNVEEFDPDPFLDVIAKQGLPWHEIIGEDLEVDRIDN